MIQNIMRLAGVVFLPVLFLFPLYAQNKVSTVGPVDGTETAKWREDLRFMAQEMPKKHQNLFHTVTREQFGEAVKKLDERIPTLARHQIIVEMAKIVAMIGDGHTAIPFVPMHGMPSRIQFRQYPMQLYFFKDGLFVRSASSEYANVVGGRVVQIGNATAESAITAVAEITSHDNDMTIKERSQSFLMMPEVLHALGLINDMEKAPLVVEKDGRRIRVELKPSTHDSMKWVDARDKAQSPVPLWLKNPDEFYWFEYLPATRTMYVQFNQVVNKPDENIKAFFKRVLEQVESSAVDRLVIDLRNNDGGDAFYSWDLIYDLIRSDKINQPGKLFAIIGRKTFSAAGATAVMLERHTNTIFAGEQPGSSPNGYGNHDIIQLPNSGISVMVAPLYFQNSTPFDNRKWIEPQIFVELTSKDYETNTDPILSAIVRYKSLAERMNQSLSGDDLPGALRNYREFKADPVNKYAATSGTIYRIGNQLLDEKRYEKAIEILKLNVESYPKSWRAYDTLAEAYMKSGNRELAIKNYKTSLELEPFNDGAKEMLRRLGVELPKAER
jgi:tetratricopeptide (TPR) repeat protein